MLAAVDGDIVVYRAAFAAESRVYTACEVNEEGMVDAIPFFHGTGFADLKAKAEELGIEEYVTTKEIVAEPVEYALSNAKSLMTTTLEDTGADDYFVALSTGEESFRHKLATVAKYKGNRKDAPKPVHYEAVRTYLIDNWGAKVFKAVEADDVLALLQHELPDTIICSNDKDLLQIPGKHYNLATKETTMVDPLEGDHRLYMQALTGDLIDNIVGINRMGAKTAAKIIEPLESVEEMRETCEARWKAYLTSPKSKKTELFKHLTSREAFEETLALVLVGGKDAVTALNESREIEKVLPLQVDAGEGDSSEAD